jgi:S1-C subfamily serine protease
VRDPLSNEHDEELPAYKPADYQPGDYATTHDYSAFEYGLPEPPDNPSEPTGAPQPVPSFPHRPARSMAAAMLAAGLVIGSIGGGAVGALLAAHHNSAAPVSQNGSGVTAAGVAAPAPSPGSYAAIYQEVKDGIVTITTQVGGGGFRSFSQAQGSGIEIDKSGDILTNAHVVDSASQVQVQFSSGQSVTGQVKGVDQSDDLAIVKVSASEDQLHPLPMGNSDTLQVGDTALAIGAPFGLQGSFTSGIISGLNRTTTAPNGRALTDMIQTDAPINPGNSGGALLDGRGQLIGINDSIDSPVEGNVGVGFAIPINKANSLIKPLENGQAIQHAWLGISGQTLDATTASQLGINGAQSGVLVVTVVPGGPADKAGLQASGQPDSSDDVITAIDGRNLNSIDQLTQYLNTKHVGDRVTLTVVRNGQTITVRVTLGNFQAQPSATP